ncbi:MAG: hypothetical protein ACRC4W_02135 [Treponemataceae bacterium]
MNTNDIIGLEMNELIMRQNNILTLILADQRLIRQAVVDRNWETLDQTIHKVQILSDEFESLENKRQQLLGQIDCESGKDIYQIAYMFSESVRQSLLENFRLMRQKLAVSKIENDSITDYVRITKGFLQGVFESVVPQRRSKVYSNSGKIVDTVPESVILNRLF